MNLQGRPTSLVRAVMIAGAVLLAALLAGRSSDAAESGYSFAATAGKLPKTVIPTHYAIDLTPDVERLIFTGSETVDIEVLQPTAVLVLNAAALTLATAAVEGAQAQPAQIVLDAANETATLTFAEPLAAGRHTLRIAFAGQINRYGRGLFSVDYPTDAGSKRMISSHLEPADARRVFPCWDEPAFKASFALTVTVASNFRAVSNMPVVREEPVGSAAKRVSFAPTPKMSSYLFVLTAGELEALAGEVDGTQINVITTQGKPAHGRFALDSAVDLLRYFNDYFGVKYPLPKLDLIAVPGGFGGAMENWGGITFFESRLLFDPASQPAAARRGIFIILAHEMAHQWFGNLVTMGWWDNLWLNEGFASWMQSKSAEHFHPDWQTWLNGSKQQAMSEDARRSTHPVQQPVANETEAMAIFDLITYSKGQALIRMLESYLGEDAFRAGIRQYMRDHAFSNATTADLWRALETASGRPVTAIAAAFTEQEGVPLVVGETTCTGERQHMTLRQERFTIHDPNAAPKRWPVPIAVGPVRAERPPEVVLLQDGAADIEAGRCGEAVKLNLGDVGYYRTQYDEATRARLAKSMAAMAPADRVNLLADTWALVEAGRLLPAAFFQLLGEIAQDSNRAVWEQVIRTFGRLDYLQRGRAGRPVFQTYARAQLRPVFDRLGWDPNADEPADHELLRVRLIGMLGQFGDAEILAEARRRFAAFLQDPAAVRPDLRDTITHLAGRAADRDTYRRLLTLARGTTNTSERVRYYQALAAALDPALAAETLAITLTDELPSTLVGGVIHAVAWAGEQPDLAWTFVRTNFEALVARQGPYFRNYFASELMTSFTDTARATELAGFAPVHETSGGRIVAARAEAAILAAADFSARQLPAVDDWLKRGSTRQ